MRIHLKTSGTNKIIPFNYCENLTGAIHKWMGWNNEHGKVSLYSFSWFQGCNIVKTGLTCKNGTSFFFSSHIPDLIKILIKGIQNDPIMFEGLEIRDIIIEEDPDLSNREFFQTSSPIFIKRKIGDKIEHILYNNPLSSEYLKETLQTKMKIAGIVDESLNILFDLSYPKAATKLVTYNGIQNRTSWCPVIINGNPDTKLFAWNVGLGNSTGIGFGAIK